MKIIKKIMLAIAIYCTGIDAQQALTTALSQQEATALRLIGAMQESVREYQSLQNQIKNNTTITKINSLKMIFSQSLDQYLTMFGQVYEKQTGLFGGYQLAYHITSNKNQNEPITPNEYTMLINTLQQAAQPSDWGKTVNLKLSVIKNGLINKKTLTLQEIIKAIKQVPLPTNYSVTNIAISAAAIAALAIGAAIVYNSTMKQPANPAVATILPPAQQVLQSPGAEPIKPEIAPQVTAAVTPQVTSTSPAPAEGQTIVATSAGYIDALDTPSTDLQDLGDIHENSHENDDRFSTELINGIKSGVQSVLEKTSDMLPKVPQSFVAAKKQTPGALYKRADYSIKSTESGKFGAHSLNHYMKYYATDAGFDETSRYENYIQPSKIDMYPAQAVQATAGFIGETIEDSVKHLINLPGDIIDTATHIKENIINPSPELVAQTDQYIALLESMAPADLRHIVEEQGGLLGTDLDTKIAVEASTKSLALAGSLWTAKTAGKALINPKASLQDAKEVLNNFSRNNLKNKINSAKNTMGFGKNTETIISSQQASTAVKNSVNAPKITQPQGLVDNAIATMGAQFIGNMYLQGAQYLTTPESENNDEPKSIISTPLTNPGYIAAGSQAVANLAKNAAQLPHK